MIQFSSVKLLWHTKLLWSKFFIRQKDIDEATPTPVEAGMDLKEAVLSLQAQINSLISSS